MTQPVHEREGLLGGTKDVKENPVFNDQGFKLGTFASNVSGGIVQSRIPTGFRVTWDQQIQIAQTADRIGLEAVVPVGRWLGFRGDTNFNGICYETFTWAAGIAQATENVGVFTTLHLPSFHPVAAAKMAATVDHISAGRYGLNLTMGWFPPEMELFQAKQLAHDERYAFGQDWLDFANALWDPSRPAGEDFDWDGPYFTARGAHSLPHPIQNPRPALVNAGASKAGQDFSARNVDINLISLPTEEMKAYVDSIKRKANDDYNRDIDVWTYCLVICRETEAEARAVREKIIEGGDEKGAENLMAALGMQSQSFGTQLKSMKERFYAGGGGPTLMGTPEQIAEQFAELKEAGVSGAIFGMLDYGPELEVFGAEVLPAMVKAGIRHA
jgi:FMNH2-dependent dimethyl sulfone monooxygenase